MKIRPKKKFRPARDLVVFITARLASIFISIYVAHIYDFHIFTVILNDSMLLKPSHNIRLKALNHKIYIAILSMEFRKDLIRSYHREDEVKLYIKKISK